MRQLLTRRVFQYAYFLDQQIRNCALKHVGGRHENDLKKPNPTVVSTVIIFHPYFNMERKSSSSRVHLFIHRLRELANCTIEFFLPPNHSNFL